MKKYTKPEVEILVLTNTDVVTASGGINVAKFSNTKGYTEIKDF